MMEPWFDPNAYGWLPGTLLGVIGGGIGGPLMGACAPRGKCKRLVMSFLFGGMALCLISLIFGIIALAVGQPYGVWYGLGLPGILGLTIFGSLTPVVRKRYQQAELRKSMAGDL